MNRRATKKQIAIAGRFWRWLHDAQEDPPDPSNESAAAGGAATARGKTKTKCACSSNLTAAKDPTQAQSVAYMRRLYRLAKSPSYQRAVFYWLSRHMNPQPLRRRG